MKDLSKTEIQVSQDTKLVVPNSKQIDELISLFKDPSNLAFSGKYSDWPHNPKIKERFRDWLDQSAKGTFLPLIAIYGGKIAGIFRFIDINYDHEKVELGYILLPKFTKKGIASSCVRSMLNFSFNDLKFNRVELIIDSKNEDSINLAKRLNFTYEGTLRQDHKYKYSQPGVFSDGQIWSVLKEEYNL